MIVPVRCCSCGKVLAHLYPYYEKEVRERKLSNQKTEKVLYLTAENREKTPEGEVMDELQVLKYCCRRILLTHVDIF